MPPLYAVICLLSLLNKEAGLFNSQAEYRQVGSPYKGEGGKKSRVRETSTAAGGER